MWGCRRPWKDDKVLGPFREKLAKGRIEDADSEQPLLDPGLPHGGVSVLWVKAHSLLYSSLLWAAGGRVGAGSAWLSWRTTGQEEESQFSGPLFWMNGTTSSAFCAFCTNFWWTLACPGLAPWTGQPFLFFTDPAGAAC